MFEMLFKILIRVVLLLPMLCPIKKGLFWEMLKLRWSLTKDLFFSKFIKLNRTIFYWITNVPLAKDRVWILTSQLFRNTHQTFLIWTNKQLGALLEDATQSKKAFLCLTTQIVIQPEANHCFKSVLQLCYK